MIINKIIQMKKFTKTSVLIILITVILSSCSKDNPSPSPNNKGINGSGCLISSIDSNGVNILNYEYNSDNKISKITNTKNNTATFSYSDTKITIQENKNGISTNSYLALGATGLVKQFYIDDIVSGSAKITDTINYTYDTNNYVIKAEGSYKVYSNGQFYKGGIYKTYSILQNGNYIVGGTIGGQYNAGTVPPNDTLDKATYEYYLDKTNQVFPDNSSNLKNLILEEFKSFSSKNLVKTSNIFHNGKSTKRSAVYTFTDKGLINTATMSESINGGNPQSYVLTIHYNCK